MQVKYCVLLLVLYIAIPAYAQKIEFFSEDISFGIDSVFFLVNGDYSFRNNSGESRSMVIVYPIRNNNTTKPFDTILVFNNDN
ncbi:MAG: hypothetical protein WCR72_13670 [Bacteroidota bacterium]